MRISRHTLWAAVATVGLSGASGCTSPMATGESAPSLLQRLPWVSDGDEMPEPYPEPARMAATWTHDTLVQAGRTPTRGFGGRIFFFNEKSKAVPVEGTLVVHGFDELADAPEGRMKRFAFTPEQLTRHFGRTDLGASYSIWIPWDAVGGKQRQISLVPTFKSKTGKTIQGMPTKVLLPGRQESPEERFADKLSPQYRRWRDASDGGSGKPSGLTTTTIPRGRTRIRTSPGTSPGPARSHGSGTVAGGGETPSHDVGKPQRPATRRPKAMMPASTRLPKPE